MSAYHISDNTFSATVLPYHLEMLTIKADSGSVNVMNLPPGAEAEEPEALSEPESQSVGIFNLLISKVY